MIETELNTKKVKESIARLQKSFDKLEVGFNSAGIRIIAKAKENAPVKTGDLRRNITFKVDRTKEDLELTVFDPVPYTIYQEQGTQFIKAKWFIKNAITETRSYILDKIKEAMK